jgi:hypothetical protein
VRVEVEGEGREFINHVPFTKIHKPPIADSRIHHAHSAIVQPRRSITKKSLPTKKERKPMKRLNAIIATALFAAVAVSVGQPAVMTTNVTEGVLPGSPITKGGG